LYAQTSDLIDSIEEDMLHFNEVATLTKENENYQPYIISTFKGKELEKLGISNLKEALTLVPGVDMATDNFNNQTPIFRGSNPQAYGQSKLFIDDVLVNNVFFDSYSEYLSFPIEMIKRIEVVRGPGSKTDGFNAYAGSIHVVTYAENFKDLNNNDKLIFKYGSYDYIMGGFVTNFNMDSLSINTDFYYQQDDKSLYAGPDGLSQGVFGEYNKQFSQTGYAPVWLKEYSLGLNMKYKDFSLKGRIHQHTQGSAYGINLALPLKDDRLKSPNYYLELGYNTTINNYEIDIKAGVKYDAFDSKSKLGPDGLALSATAIFNDGVYSEHFASQVSLYQSSFIKYTALSKHTITFGYRFLNEETTDMVSKLSNRTNGNVGLVDYTETLPFFDVDAKRNTTIISLQDEFTYDASLSFLYGINYESTSLNNTNLNPRISIVYQPSLDNIFKAIYSRSHRNPSWQEMFTKNNQARVGNIDLNAERVDAFEFAYIKKLSSDTYTQANIFYLINKDQIYNSSTSPMYQNVVDTNIHGIELEYKSNLTLMDQLYVNYTYVNGNTFINGTKYNSLPNVANSLAKAYYIFNFTSELALSSIIKYTGSKDRVSEDSREKVKAYTTLDLALQYDNTKYDYKLTLSAKNVTNETVKFPSPPDTYYEDYLQESRNFLITVVKEF